MKQYIIYDSMGKILRYGQCSEKSFSLQVDESKDEHIMGGIASDYWNKIVDGKIVMKTSEEIDADNPPPEFVLPKDRRADITNQEWEEIKAKIRKLEKR